MYIFYVIFLVFSDKFQDFFDRCCSGCFKKRDSEKVSLVSEAIKSYGVSTDSVMQPDVKIGLGVKNPSIEDIRSNEGNENEDEESQVSHHPSMLDHSTQTEKRAFSETSEESIGGKSPNPTVKYTKLL